MLRKLMTFNFNVRFTLSVSLVNLSSVNQGARGMPWIVYLLWVFHHYGMKCAYAGRRVWWLNVDRYADDKNTNGKPKKKESLI